MMTKGECTENRADLKSTIEGLNDLHAVACGLDGTQCYVNGIGIRQLRTLTQDTTSLLSRPVVIGRWVKVTGNFLTPGGTPYFVCGGCGGTGHLYGVEYTRRKVLCDVCGRVNIYPHERAHEEGTALWEDAEGATDDR